MFDINKELELLVSFDILPLPKLNVSDIDKKELELLLRSELFP